MKSVLLLLSCLAISSLACANAPPPRPQGQHNQTTAAPTYSPPAISQRPVYREPGAPPGRVATKSQSYSTGNWLVEEYVDRMNDSVTVVLALPSDNLVDGNQGILLVGCTNGHSGIYVRPNVPVKSHGYEPKRSVIRLRFDDETPINIDAEEFDAGNLLEISTERTMSVWNFRRNRELLIEFEPLRGSTEIFQFTLTGYDETTKKALAYHSLGCVL